MPLPHTAVVALYVCVCEADCVCIYTRVFLSLSLYKKVMYTFCEPDRGDALNAEFSDVISRFEG